MLGLGHQELHDASAEVEAIEYDVAGYHGRCEAKPEHRHYRIPPRASTASLCGRCGSGSAAPASGPCATSRMTRSTNSMPNSRYSPINPSSVNNPFPADTRGEAPSMVRMRP